MNELLHFGLRDSSFAHWQRQQAPFSQIAVLTDENTRRLCLPVFLPLAGLQPHDIRLITVPAGEQHKSVATAEAIWNSMLEAGLDRQSLLVNLGGGVIGDMGGFCAATYKRGIRFVQAPTTLLAMTDAAIGGKLGVDFAGLKNIIGVFRNPEAVFIDPVFLQTLPERELRSGLAEVIKHGMIGSDALLDLLDEGTEGIDWPTLLRWSTEVKLRIVANDPQEQGPRALLNFGHTVGHALESCFLNDAAPLTHGEAVAIGMAVELYLAEGESPRLARLMALYRRFFSYRPVPESLLDALWAFMQHDKKNASGSVLVAVPDADHYSLRRCALDAADLQKGFRFYNQALGNNSNTRAWA